jgi:hypothetical protein
MPAAVLALADPPPAPMAPEPAAAPTTVVPLPKKRGPNTPEGKARSRQNALKHGLRAKLLPLPPAGDDAAYFAELADGLRATYRPEDAAEAQLVEAIAVAMWQEITADRLEAEALAAMAGGDGRPFHGGMLLESPANRATLHTVLRYQASASCAVGRAMRLFFQHRRAKRDGLLATGNEIADEICTNELPTPGAAPANDDSDRREAPPPAEPTPPARTNETPRLPLQHAPAAARVLRSAGGDDATRPVTLSADKPHKRILRLDRQDGAPTPVGPSSHATGPDGSSGGSAPAKRLGIAAVGSAGPAGGAVGKVRTGFSST